MAKQIKVGSSDYSGSNIRVYDADEMFLRRPAWRLSGYPYGIVNIIDPILQENKSDYGFVYDKTEGDITFVGEGTVVIWQNSVKQSFSPTKIEPSEKTCHSFFDGVPWFRPTCEWFEINVCHQGRRHLLSWHQGELLQPLRDVGLSKREGIRFALQFDPALFASGEPWAPETNPSLLEFVRMWRSYCRACRRQFNAIGGVPVRTLNLRLIDKRDPANARMVRFRGKI
jgi:hypothetical protein